MYQTRTRTRFRPRSHRGLEPEAEIEKREARDLEARKDELF